MTTLLKPTEAISVLVVDDTPDNLRLLTKTLESHHYKVRKALNGKMALLGANRNPPDLILLDINMPGMNGYEVCQQLKASAATANIPIIFISALDQIHDKVRAFEMGGHDYITKPFHELEILARVKNQLLLQEQRQQLEEEIESRQTAEAEVQRLNMDLERTVQVRTLELQQALEFEATLKQITDQVRDSLDQHQILQAAVEALAIALQVKCCDAVLYSPDHQSSTVRYQALASGLTGTEGQLLHMADAPEIYDQLQNQQSCLAFCQIRPLKIRNDSATLACPIFDEQVDQTGILGDLWVFKDKASSFSDMEIHLVQQVANQCAIALRQARLYEAAQAQVKELERLNQLKDDFLSTISHELRTPIASIQMVMKLLNTVTDHGHNLMAANAQAPTQPNKVVQYFKILQEECDRELALVNDLLSLQQIEAGSDPTQLTPIDLQTFLPHLIEPFETRTQTRQQRLQVNLAPDLPTLNLDPSGLKRLLTELLSNACKYTPAGGTIAITASIAPAETLPNSTHCLQLSVTNTGVEIAPEELPRVFDKFYRIPNNDPWKHGGTGLGLALVKKLVEKMNGTIAVESAHNQVCFRVWLAL